MVLNGNLFVCVREVNSLQITKIIRLVVCHFSQPLPNEQETFVLQSHAQSIYLKSEVLMTWL